MKKHRSIGQQPAKKSDCRLAEKPRVNSRLCSIIRLHTLCLLVLKRIHDISFENAGEQERGKLPSRQTVLSALCPAWPHSAPSPRCVPPCPDLTEDCSFGITTSSHSCLAYSGSAPAAEIYLGSASGSELYLGSAPASEFVWGSASVSDPAFLLPLSEIR